MESKTLSTCNRYIFSSRRIDSYDGYAQRVLQGRKKLVRGGSARWGEQGAIYPPRVRSPRLPSGYSGYTGHSGHSGYSGDSGIAGTAGTAGTAVTAVTAVTTVTAATAVTAVTAATAYLVFQASVLNRRAQLALGAQLHHRLPKLETRDDAVAL